MLGKAEWPLLKKADFSLRLGWGPSWELLFSPSFSAACLVSSVLGVSGPRCFWENGEGAEGLLGALCRCRELEDAGGGGGEPGASRSVSRGVAGEPVFAGLQGPGYLRTSTFPIAARSPSRLGRRCLRACGRFCGTRRASRNNFSADCGAIGRVDTSGGNSFHS